MQRSRIQEHLGYNVSSMAQPRPMANAWNIPGSFNMSQQRFSLNSYPQGNFGGQARVFDSFVPSGTAGIGERNVALGINGQLNYSHVDHSVAKTVPSVFDLNIGMPAALSGRQSSRNVLKHELNGNSQQADRLPSKRFSDDESGFQSSSFKKRNQNPQTLGSFDTSTHGEKSKYRCQVCRVQFSTLLEFDAHMASSEHAAKMSLLSVVCDTNQQHQSSVRYCRNDSRSGMCSICDQPFGILSEAQHNASKAHNTKKCDVAKGCQLCKIYKFRNFTELLHHNESAAHKEKKKALQKSHLEKPTDKPELKNTDVCPEKPAQIPETTTTKPEVINNAASEPTASEVMTESNVSEKPVELSLDDLKYDADTAVGVEEVINVTGFFCKLCHKFYSNETMARVTHCKSQAHFNKYYESVQKLKQQKDATSTQTTSSTDQPQVAATVAIQATVTSRGRTIAVSQRGAAVRGRP